MPRWVIFRWEISWWKFPRFVFTCHSQVSQDIPRVIHVSWHDTCHICVMTPRVSHMCHETPRITYVSRHTGVTYVSWHTAYHICVMTTRVSHMSHNTPRVTGVSWHTICDTSVSASSLSDIERVSLNGISTNSRVLRETCVSRQLWRCPVIRTPLSWNPSKTSRYYATEGFEEGFKALHYAEGR